MRESDCRLLLKGFGSCKLYQQRIQCHHCAHSDACGEFVIVEEVQRINQNFTKGEERDGKIKDPNGNGCLMMTVVVAEDESCGIEDDLWV